MLFILASGINKGSAQKHFSFLKLEEKARAELLSLDKVSRPQSECVKDPQGENYPCLISIEILRLTLGKFPLNLTVLDPYTGWFVHRIKPFKEPENIVFLPNIFQEILEDWNEIDTYFLYATRPRRESQSISIYKKQRASERAYFM